MGEGAEQVHGVDADVVVGGGGVLGAGPFDGQLMTPRGEGAAGPDLLRIDHVGAVEVQHRRRPAVKRHLGDAVCRALLGNQPQVGAVEGDGHRRALGVGIGEAPA